MKKILDRIGIHRLLNVLLPGVFFSFPLFFSVSCRSVPLTGRYQLMLTLSGYENFLGSSAYKEYKQQYKRSENPIYNQALTRCGQAISEAAGDTGFNWEFTVLESSEQNAFCLPGGKVAVYSGIMKQMRNEAELAFVVGHEIGHAIARHGGERMSWGFLRTVGGILVAIGFENDFINDIYGTGTQLGVMLPYSRSHEREADYLGLILMAKAGYDPHASVQFWTRFGSKEEANPLQTLLSTHPCDAERIKAMNENMARAEEEYRKAKLKRGYGIPLDDMFRQRNRHRVFRSGVRRYSK